MSEAFDLVGARARSVCILERCHVLHAREDVLIDVLDAADAERRHETLPEGPEWIYELKLDGYRALAVKSGRRVELRSRNDNDFTGKYPAIVKALERLPDESVIDGEVVAFDASGRPSFNTLQNHGSAVVFYYVFDVLVLGGRNLTREPLDVRRGLLQTKVLPKLGEPVRHAPELQGSLHDLLDAVRSYGFEGLIAKRRDSVYEPGKRSGTWRKMRVNQGQEFVIGGYTPSAHSFDALIFGYYDGDQLIYVARTRNSFTPRSRLDLFGRLGKLETATCPFSNLPEAKSGRWGQGLTAAKMTECRWVKRGWVGYSTRIPSCSDLVRAAERGRIRRCRRNPRILGDN